MGSLERKGVLVEELIPPQQTMDEITLIVPADGRVPLTVLRKKLRRLYERGLMDAGLVLVNDAGILQGYLAQGELDLGLVDIGHSYSSEADARLSGKLHAGELDMSRFIDYTPISISARAPLEYALEMFGTLGLRYLMITEDESGRLIGVAIRKRLVAFVDRMKHE